MVLSLTLSFAVEVWIPDIGGVSLNVAMGKNAVFGIQY